MNVLTDLNIIGSLSDLKVKIGTDSEHIEIKDNILLKGGYTCWTDLEGPASTAKKGATNKPDFDYDNLTLDFPQNDDTERAYYSIQFPHEWKSESTIYPHVHFIQTQNLTPTFVLEYRWLGIGDVIPSWSSYTLNTLAKTYTSGSMHQILTNVNGIDGTGKELSSIFQCVLYRTDNTYIGDCKVLSFDIHIEIDSFGSKEEYIK